MKNKKIIKKRENEKINKKRIKIQKKNRFLHLFQNKVIKYIVLIHNRINHKKHKLFNKIKKKYYRISF